MRCQKARSFLSAYSNGELTGRTRLTVAEHLTGCSSCRQEETFYRTMRLAGADLPKSKLSDDFNTRLLNRIGQERFRETRTKAYQPKNAPIFSWGKAIPVFVSACLVILVGVMVFQSGGSPVFNAGGNHQYALDDSYLTAEPIDNLNRTTRVNNDWSFNGQMAKAERIRGLSNSLTSAESFGSGNHSLRPQSHLSRTVPFVSSHFRIRPVIKIYISPEGHTGREDSQDY